MTRHSIASLAGAGLLVFLPIAGYGQTAPQDLRSRLAERYDIVALQQGVALVPRQPDSGLRMIQVVEGVINVDGEVLTGQQLRERLGADADLVLQASYLGLEQQRELAGGPAAPSPPPSPAAASRDTVERSVVTRGDIVRFGSGVTVADNERVEGDVVVFGGSADVDGEVTGDLVAFGGEVRLGPQAVVRGDVTVMGGALDRASGSQILGSTTEVGRGRRGAGAAGGRFPFSAMFGPFWSRVGSLAATVLRIGLLVLLGLVVAAFGRNAIEQIAARTAAGPLRAGLIGFAAQILFLPVLVLTIVVLAVSIIGIPLLALVPFAILLLLIVMLVGFVGLAYHVGQGIASRLGWTGRGAYAAVAAGIVAIGAITLLGRLAGVAGGFLFGAPLSAVGYVIEYVAWTIGFGAAILAWYEMQTTIRRRRGTASAPAAPPVTGEA